jgi:hypothetical protein
MLTAYPGSGPATRWTSPDSGRSLQSSRSRRRQNSESESDDAFAETPRWEVAESSFAAVYWSIVGPKRTLVQVELSHDDAYLI